jgi:multidrug efflux pump subunit AcrB
VTGKALSMPSMIGLIMLMGIVTKNSILLVDYAILARQAGMNRFDALVDACHKRSRPIIMTTIAMGAGMMPLALGWGADPSFRSPMAIAVIGGLITSTLLSLLVVPAVFTYVDDGQLQAEGKVSEGACFERYPADYTMDPVTGVFNAELCIPVK